MRLVYFGSGAFGLPTLERLAVIHDVALVVTRPDRPAGRRRGLTPTPVAAFADSRGLPVFKPPAADDPETLARVRGAGAEAYVVIAYGHKLGLALLEGVFAINLHGSLLPKYRGAAPINWAMINGDDTTGVSVITLAQRMDAGAVVASAAAAIDRQETAGELHDRLAAMGPAVVLDALDRHEGGRLAPREQDETRATTARRLTKADGTVGFDQPAERVRCRVHGLTPWPGCAVTLDGRRLHLRRVAVAADGGPSRGEPGTIGADGLVACRPGAVELLNVQPPSGRMMSFEAYRRGHVLPAGARMECL